MDEKENNFSTTDREVADQVADEILTVYEEDDDRRFFLLLLFFLVCLIFLVSSISFAIFETYDNNINNTVIDVGVDVDVDKCTRNCDTNGDGICDLYCDKENKDDKNKDNTNTNNQKDKDDDNEEHKPIKPGTILFSFDEGSSYIDIADAYPMYDSVGKTLSGDKEFFDFNISVDYSGKSSPITYEISAVPVKGNTLDENDIRMYLTEDGRKASINSKEVNSFSKLPDSKFNKNGKVIFKRTVKSDYSAGYVFRMWIDSKAELNTVVRKFGCKIVVNGYYDS